MSERYSYDRGAPATSLSATNSNGAGDEFGFPPYLPGARLPSNFTWQTVVSGGTYSALQVDLEGSIDGTNWKTLDTTTTVGGEMRHVVSKPMRYLRLNKVSSTTATVTPVVTGTFVA